MNDIKALSQRIDDQRRQKIAMVSSLQADVAMVAYGSDHQARTNAANHLVDGVAELIKLALALRVDLDTYNAEMRKQ